MANGSWWRNKKNLFYRRDADITLPYGELQPQEGDMQDFSMNKSNLVCWVVSNFNSHYHRSKVYKELRAWEISAEAGSRQAPLQRVFQVEARVEGEADHRLEGETL
uniref:Uncharacterized protein n=1 Tax=Knipowitschia caucasica TaxID=637954 RepID=A0AAV2IY36_KNICA